MSYLTASFTARDENGKEYHLRMLSENPTVVARGEMELAYWVETDKGETVHILRPHWLAIETPSAMVQVYTDFDLKAAASARITGCRREVQLATAAQ